ncbi:PASTA domain-containing protein [Kitasatospora cineracea]|uniref:PASTA domain-containing protein n=1 Tax=Kitasatospora cineracea TaxID=88074 RepID=A0A8G1UC95_9ACTN|nr:PASTA domain-containing protein [Kitasatospora cineracea]ROR38107.1 PASTA domain-containing protein [Kitasatospora cineracea]
MNRPLPGPAEGRFDRELRDALAAFADHPAAPVVDAAAIERAAARHRRTGRGLLALAAAAALLAAGGAFALRPASSDGPATSPVRPSAVGCTVPGPPAGGLSGAASATRAPETPQNATVTLPELAGLPLERAAAALHALGLRCTVVLHTDRTTPAGQVMSSDPRSGREPVAPDSLVTLYVSKGRPGGS